MSEAPVSDLARASFRRLSGPFYRTVLAERADQVLDPPHAGSAGRYHRIGQPALYMSPKKEWAIIATSGYMREDGLRRVVVPLMLDEALVVHQEDAGACTRLGIDPSLSSSPWRKALAEGQEPLSWRVSDAARAAGADGLIDLSRQIAGGWHLTLFRWNAEGTPRVQVCGEAEEITLGDLETKWGL